MNLFVFNVAIGLGWWMVLVGGMLYNVALGLVCGGLLLLAITAYVVRLGGVFVPPPAKQPAEDPDVPE